MHWELWDADSGNFIWRCASEGEALTMVKEMLDDGWNAEQLGLIQSPDTKEELATLKRKPAIYGETLLQRLAAFEQERADLALIVKVVNQTAAELKQVKQDLAALDQAVARRKPAFDLLEQYDRGESASR